MATIPEALAIAIQRQRAGELPAAEDICRQILAVEPEHADAWHVRGVVAHQLGRHAEAIDYLARAIRANGDVGSYYHNLGEAFFASGKITEAIGCYRQALRVGPELPETYNNLGIALRRQGITDQAIASYRRAIERNPAYAEAHNNLANALLDAGQTGAAVEGYRRAIGLKPDYAEAWSNLGLALKDLAAFDEAFACYRRALALRPDNAAMLSNLLSGLQYQPGITLAELAAAHEAYDRLHAGQPRPQWRRVAREADAERRLRLGFVSPDLGRHPVGYFLAQALEHLPRDAFETIAYSDLLRPDDMTRRLRAACAAWRDTAAWGHAQLAEQIHADGVDILFDLAGHTFRNRLPAFAAKPARLQITWAGGAGTTGLRAMDYILADRHEIPPAAEPYYCECVLRMPDGYVCYEPPGYAPPVAPPPVATEGRITFGCCNLPAKVNGQVLAAWAQILHRVPDSRLLLKFRGMDEPATAARITQGLADQGIPASRIELQGGADHAALLATYGRIDLALDPFPYNGGLTTCEALWMGVPVITCPGETFAGRHALSHLSNVGCTETIAGDANEYVDLAVRLAGDLPRLAALRGGLRSRMAASPLCDGKRFSASLADVLRTVWRQWCRGEARP